MQIPFVNLFSRFVEFKMWIMLHLWFAVMFLMVQGRYERYRKVDPKEKEHDPRWLTPPALSRNVNGTMMTDPLQTPDWRLEEPPFKPYPAYKNYHYYETNRPFRISPHDKQTYRWKKVHVFMFENQNIEYPDNLGCYCTTVYKKFTPLGGCAVLTPRHVLTTATSTEIVLKDRRESMNLEGILGLWYDVSGDRYNSSYYATPARIHYHPRYLRPEKVNITHPIPMHYDIAVWATTYNMHDKVLICQRANSGWWEYGTTTPFVGEKSTQMIIVVGFQFIKAHAKKPMPWYKYAVRTRNWVVPCPKIEWGWFHCLEGHHLWSKFGVESGAAWHRALRGSNWMRDGLAGMNSFSMRLRSSDIVHYFTVLNTHPILDFLYDAYMGRLPYDYLDGRFQNNQWKAPEGKPEVYIWWTDRQDRGRSDYDWPGFYPPYY